MFTLMQNHRAFGLIKTIIILVFFLKMCRIRYFKINFELLFLSLIVIRKTKEQA